MRGATVLALGLLLLPVPGFAPVLGFAAPDLCARYGAARQVGRVPAALHELSGLAASRRHPGIYWGHNDSGNALVLFAMRENGTIVARFPLRGAGTRDPEDIGVGPCAPGALDSCVWLADTGDNNRKRQAVQLVRVHEPPRLRDATLDADALPFRYADGPRNAEALLVDPHSGAIFVVSKALSSLGDVFRLDGLGTRGGGRAVYLRTLRAPDEFDSFTTGAGVHPSGRSVLLRTYRRVWEFRAPGARSLEDVLAVAPHVVPSATQPQGEGVTYLADGLGYVLASEGEGAPLFRVDCEAGR